MNNDEIKLAVGGPVQSHNGTYLRRSADKQLFDTCVAGKFSYVLASRQIGKSSLMHSVAEDLIKNGYSVARIDLNRIGKNIPENSNQNIPKEEYWYFGFFDELVRTLKLKIDVDEWWDSQSRRLTYSQRFLRFFEDIILMKVNGQIVVFIDEIDVTLGLSFTDDFFAVIRTIYNERVQHPEYERLNFVLLGVATPDELISDRKRTPFNIGLAINLQDFTQDECEPLIAAIKKSHPQNYSTYFNEVYWWTNGHPYLTQKLCSLLSESTDTNNLALVNKLVDQVFIRDEEYSDANLKFVQTECVKGFETPISIN